MLGSLFKTAIGAVDSWAERKPEKPPVDFSTVHPVPGISRSLDYVPNKDDPLYLGKPLPTALLQEDIERGSSTKALLPLTTIRERTMLQYMSAITDKPNWNKKVLDSRVIYKWRVEYAKEIQAGTRPLITNGSFEYCIAELQHIARNIYSQRKDGALVVFNGNVVRSDEAVSKLNKRVLQLAVKPLEHIPKPERDWHPGSKRTALDLVHPSMFPLVHGTSKILDVGERVVGLDDCVVRCGEGKVVKSGDLPPSNIHDAAEPFSSKFQWLPCEVDISGENAKIVSYINNVHPKKHADLYSAIEKIIDVAIPLWEMSLAPLFDTDFQFSPRITVDKVEYADDTAPSSAQVALEPGDPGEGMPRSRTSSSPSMPGGVAEEDPEAFWDKRQSISEDHEEEYDYIEDYDEAHDESYVDSRAGDYTDEDEYSDEESDNEEDEGPAVIHPEPKPFNPRNFKTPKSISFKKLYGRQKRPLQIIVEIVNVELTPRRPKYPGMVWNLEGRQNEHIVATALFNYSSSNITPSRLGFRQFVDADTVNEIDYEQDEYRFLRQLYGCRNGGAAVQNLGSVELKEGRLVTFPNTLQHQIQPFRINDPKRKGHRKLLALYLVDPNVRIISTANVPCQQMEWWRETLPEEVPAGTTGNPRDSVSSVGGGKQKRPEGRDHVFGQVNGFPMTKIDAKHIRVDLMKEKKRFVKAHQKELLNSNSFTLHENANTGEDYESE
ncbi:hypothetical protein DFP72DRAFT_1095567 [Ephemerocybe angulata]|uniref:Uncharacterized protein n=1 Tax=Ephemerocybe angulata TaxID=980116 RepID=A0A8H6HDH1_9AGAR|nr:hypothetical protein DFP72DRAFT_1095567 [Tulosesus angulatus]